MIAILTIGNELLVGKTVNTNAANLARYLDGFGLRANIQLSCLDDTADIVRALDFLSDAKLLLVTGGLGQTHDDISQRVFDEHFSHQIKKEIPNHIGTASGYIYESGERSAILFPGPPFENQAMFPAIEPYLTAGQRSSEYHVTGLSEYMIEQQMLPHFKPEQFATYTDQGFTTIRILAEPQPELMSSLFGERLIGIGKTTIEQTIQALALKHRLRIATVESITSGEVAMRLSRESGASEFFYGGLVVYQNQAKTQLCGIEPELLEQYTAVSPETSKALAKNFLTAHPVDLVLAITGYADHSDPELQGQSYLCCISKRGMLEEAIKLPGIRSRIRSRVAFRALDLIRRTILNFYENEL